MVTALLPNKRPWALSAAGELYEGFDEEYDCPILDEDRVSPAPSPSPAAFWQSSAR